MERRHVGLSPEGRAGTGAAAFSTSDRLPARGGVSAFIGRTSPEILERPHMGTENALAYRNKHRPAHCRPASRWASHKAQVADFPVPVRLVRQIFCACNAGFCV